MPPRGARAGATTLEIAGLRLGLSFREAAFCDLAAARYAPFLSGGRPWCRLAVSAGPGKQAPFRPELSVKKGELLAWRGDFNLSLRGSRGTLACAPREQALDSCLRALFSWLLPRKKGLLLHGACLAKNGRAYLFPGRSGAGKSTLSKLASAAGLTVLSDELVPVRRQGGRWYAYGSPFWGEMRPGTESRRFPLAGVYKLSKAGGNELRPLPAGDLVRLLMRCAMNFSRASADAALLLKLTALLAAQKNGGELRFSKADPGCFDLL